MKFGKYLQKRQLDLPEYAASFVNYKGLKKLIKHLSASPIFPPQDGPDLADGNTSRGQGLDSQTLQANKATFFFRLERELEKVNATYLQKEAEIKLRLNTLMDKKKVIKARSKPTSNVSANFVTLQEGFQHFGQDLNALQQFVQINNTAFSKILKKWDKTSKSRTKELYLSRAVEVQPCFNRDVISELSDQATTSLLELEAWAEGENIHFETNRLHNNTSLEHKLELENQDFDSRLLQAAESGDLKLLEDLVSKARESQNARAHLSRVYLDAIAKAPESSLEILLASGLVDFGVSDEITERTCLHEAAIAGRQGVLEIAIIHDADVRAMDIYGRRPLHYACISGQLDMVKLLINRAEDTLNSLDHDNFSPLIHAITHGQASCVNQLLDSGALVDTQGESEHVPLNLACQIGNGNIVQSLLQHRAPLMPDAEGLYPQHLVARFGRDPGILLMLEQHGADLDQQDKLYQWTPLMHAASEGHLALLTTLLDRNVKIDILDEKGCSAMYYAAWEGHIECMKLIKKAKELLDNANAARTADTTTAENMEISSKPVTQSIPLRSETDMKNDVVHSDFDGIPSLELPPPIIPLRRYGHNFLDDKTFVQISFAIANAASPIKFFTDNKYPASRLTISAKSNDIIPRNVMLPIQEDGRFCTFQIDNLSTFTLDFEIYPTFGSKIVAKAVALPSTFFTSSRNAGKCCLPLFDARLRAIGQITFDYQVIMPFTGASLDISHFATYWRATSHVDSHPTGFITGSSLIGEYAQVFVQLTRDRVPVVFPKWSHSIDDIDIPICRMTAAQFSSLHKGPRRNEVNFIEKPVMQEVLFLTLAELLDRLSPSKPVILRVMYPSRQQEKGFGLGTTPSSSDFADAILATVFDHTRKLKAQPPGHLRSIVFSSYNPDICLALNWKQPNYPVILCNALGSDRDHDPRFTSFLGETQNLSEDLIATSIKETVRIAQSNNLMGVACYARILHAVPVLIASIKAAGLVLLMDDSNPDLKRSEQDPWPVPKDAIPLEGINGMILPSGFVNFIEMTDA